MLKNTIHKVAFLILGVHLLGFFLIFLRNPLGIAKPLCKFLWFGDRDSPELGEVSHAESGLRLPLPVDLVQLA